MSASSRLGIELGARTVRAVQVPSGWERWRGARPQAVEIEWERDNLRETVTALREHLGSNGRLAVALDLPLVFVKQVKLPPLPTAEKQRILALEPERFFAARGDEIVVAAQPDSDLVFAAPEESVATWVSALEQLAPVVRVEPAPVALVRAVAKAGVTDATILRDVDPDGAELIVVRAGRLARVRRVFGGLVAAARAVCAEPAPPTRIFLSPWSEEGARIVASELGGAAPEPLPAVNDVAAPFLTALGAAFTIDRAPDPGSSLAPGELTARIRARRRRERLVAIVACVATLLFAVASLDAWRERALATLQTGLPALRERAAPAVALQGEIQAVQQEAQAIHAIARERAEPLRVLAALSAHLPPGAYVRSLRFSGSDWQIEGYAPNAALVLAQLSRTPALSDLHFLTATTPVTVRQRTYETFALAFRFAAAP